jgi:uncharacterized RDD family membrane protein YckC
MPYCTKCGNELSSEEKFCPKCGTPANLEQTTVNLEPVTKTASTLKLAFWGERFVAWLIDAIVIGLIVGFLNIFGWLAFATFAGWPNWVPFFNASSLLYFLYWLLMEGAYGQSLGKMAMRLRVVQLSGSRINMGQAALESAGKAFLLPIDAILGWILYPRSKQRLFNYLSETVVIREIA